MGEIAVPAGALYGAQTQRAVANFPISNLRFPREFIRAMGFVKLASAFDCDISVSHNAKKVSGKSIMGMMMLAAAKGGTIEISTSGRDEARAMNELEGLIANRFGESE